MNDFHAEPLHPDFGARLTGVDLGAPLSESEVEAITLAYEVPGEGGGRSS